MHGCKYDGNMGYTDESKQNLRLVWVVLVAFLVVNGVVYVHVLVSNENLSARVRDLEEEIYSYRLSVDHGGVESHMPESERAVERNYDLIHNQPLDHITESSNRLSRLRGKRGSDYWQHYSDFSWASPNTEEKVSKETKPLAYTSLGCWRDTHDRAIPTLEGTDPGLDGRYQDRQNPIEKCYQAALSRGFTVFAVQDDGQCFGSADARNTYNKYGPSTACTTDGKGGPWANEVYQITEVGHCEANKCQNSATCRSNEVGYTCICTEGWHGKYCHQKKRVKQKQQRIQEENYGLGSLLSVHIQAETDSSEKKGKVQVTGNFTKWRPLDTTQTRFELQNGQLKIKEPGRYFIYSQVYFDEDEQNAVARYSIKKGINLLLTCERPLTGVPPPLTCYTAGVLYLQRDDTLVLYVDGKPATINTAQDATFWGAIKLSMDIPIEKGSVSRKRKETGKT